MVCFVGAERKNEVVITGGHARKAVNQSHIGPLTGTKRPPRLKGAMGKGTHLIPEFEVCTLKRNVFLTRWLYHTINEHTTQMTVDSSTALIQRSGTGWQLRR